MVSSIKLYLGRYLFTRTDVVIAVLDDASEEEREDLFSGTTAKDSDKLRKEKLERAENLKKMMDDDDEGKEQCYPIFYKWMLN